MINKGSGAQTNRFGHGWRYARMEGFDMSDSESRGTSGSLKDFHGDSSSIEKSGEK